MYKILMVDDDPMILNVNQTYFSSMGYEIVCADTAQAAEKIILSNALDCVVLTAATANGVCLLYGVLSIGYYEPFIGTYPEEYGAFCMVIAFAVLMVRRSLAMAEENQRLRQHLQDEVNDKTEHLQKLLTERGQLIAELGHDMKSPLPHSPTWPKSSE